MHLPAAKWWLAEGLSRTKTERGEGNTAVFSGEFVLKPGESHEVVLRYRLPNSVTAEPYRLFVRKQAGTVSPPLRVQAGSCLWQTDLGHDREFECRIDAVSGRVSHIPTRNAMPIQRIEKHTASILTLLILLLLGASCSAPVRVDWSTETEINTAGFNIYRGESPDGPFDVKVNEQLIPPSPDPMTGGKYSYVDNATQLGKLYYYQLEEVERNGTQTRLGVTSARAGGVSWLMLLVLGGLAIAALIVWIVGGKRATAPRTTARPTNNSDASPSNEAKP